jgi:hypothetical protein
MKITLAILLIASMNAFAEDIDMSPTQFLRDSDDITNVSHLMYPTFIINQEMSIPPQWADENGPVVFQDGVEISADKLDKSKPYCTFGGAGFKELKDGAETEKSYTFFPGDRLKIAGPLTYRNVSEEFHLDKSLFKKGLSTKTVDQKIEFLVSSGFLNNTIIEDYYEAGYLSKNFASSKDDDKSFFSGRVMCFNFRKMPTTGDIRRLLGSQNFSLMPDETEPQSLKIGDKIVNEDYEKADKELYKEARKEMMKAAKEEIKKKLKSFRSNE